MSARAQIIINLPSLRKMLMEDMAWVSNHCPKQACISIGGQNHIWLLNHMSTTCLTDFTEYKILRLGYVGICRGLPFDKSEARLPKITIHPIVCKTKKKFGREVLTGEEILNC